MMTQKLAVAGAAAVLVFASSVSAQTGQATATRPAAPAVAINHGAALTGVCIFSSSRAVGTSAVGKHVGTRMQQIVTQVNSELTTEKTAIDTEAKAIEAGRATMDQSTLEQRAAALQVRFNAWQRKAQLRQREVEATEQKAFLRVAQEMDPVVKQVYQQRACSLLLERESVMLANPAMDVTDAVVAGVNAKIQTFAFDRERLDQQPATGQPRAQ
jgi:Skp family chaperone for outer membrane proteins